MALYLGNSGKRKVILNGVVYAVNLFLEAPIVNKIKLLSSDNYILKDCNGLYLLPSSDSIIDNSLLSSDNYILKDCDGIYLTVKESE